MFSQVVMAAVLAAAPGGGNGSFAGGQSWGYYVGAQSSVTSTGTESQPESQAQPAAPSAPLANVGGEGGGGGGGGGQAQPAVSSAPQTCGFQLSYCEPAGINVGAAQISTAAPQLPAAAAPPPPPPPRPGKTISLIVLAERAWEALYLPAPQVDTAPPRGSDGWVGIPEYFWLVPGQWAPHTARAQAGAEWAQVTAQPGQMTVTPGAGIGAVACDGPGVPYGQNGTPCTYLYARDSLFQLDHAYTVTVTVTWHGTWAGAGGAGGVLPDVVRTTTFALPVAEGQALVDRG